MRPIPKQYIHEDDYKLSEIEAVELQYDRWVDDLLSKIEDQESYIRTLTLENDRLQGYDHT